MTNDMITMAQKTVQPKMWQERWPIGLGCNHFSHLLALSTIKAQI